MLAETTAPVPAEPVKLDSDVSVSVQEETPTRRELADVLSTTRKEDWENHTLLHFMAAMFTLAALVLNGLALVRDDWITGYRWIRDYREQNEVSVGLFTPASLGGMEIDLADCILFSEQDRCQEFRNALQATAALKVTMAVCLSFAFVALTVGLVKHALRSSAHDVGTDSDPMAVSRLAGKALIFLSFIFGIAGDMTFSLQAESAINYEEANRLTYASSGWASDLALVSSMLCLPAYVCVRFYIRNYRPKKYERWSWC